MEKSQNDLNAYSQFLALFPILANVLKMTIKVWTKANINITY